LNGRSKLRQPEDAFIEWVINTPPIRLLGAAAIFTVATTKSKSNVIQGRYDRGW
jgi:hypothetical protein